MRFKMYWLILIIVIIIKSQNGFAQSNNEMVCNTGSCCCGNDPTPAGVMISHVHKKNEWMFSYRYMNMNMSGIQKGTQKMSNSDVFVNYLMSSDKMRMDMHMLMAMYGITDKLTVMGMLNYNVQSMNMNMLESGMTNMPGMNMGSSSMPSSMKSAGFSDIKLYTLYGLINKENKQLLISAGVSIPTGSTVLKGNTSSISTSQHLPYSMQLGSGTIDALPGVTYLYEFSKWTFSTQLLGAIHLGYTSAGYKKGNELSSNNWVSYRWTGFLSTSLRAEATSMDKIKGYDSLVYYFNEPSSNPNNYGGQKVNCYAGAVWQFKSGFLKKNRVGVEYGLPVYQNVNGIQTKQSSTINAFWAYAF